MKTLNSDAEGDNSCCTVFSRQSKLDGKHDSDKESSPRVGFQGFLAMTYGKLGHGAGQICSIESFPAHLNLYATLVEGKRYERVTNESQIRTHAMAPQTGPCDDNDNE